MFVIVPLIIIFLLSSYLYVNEVSVTMQITISSLIVGVVFISLYLYRSIQKNLQQQEINSIQIEINALKVKMQKLNDEKEKEYILHKIELLEEEKLSKNK